MRWWCGSSTPTQPSPSCSPWARFIGLLNGLLIVRIGIPDLLATLSSMFLLAGLQLIPTGGRSITSGMIMPNGETAPGAYDPAFFPLGRARLWDVVPLPVVIMAVSRNRLLVLHGTNALGPRLLRDRRQPDGRAPCRRHRPGSTASRPMSCQERWLRSAA